MRRECAQSHVVAKLPLEIIVVWADQLKARPDGWAEQLCFAGAVRHGTLHIAAQGRWGRCTSTQ